MTFIRRSSVISFKTMSHFPTGIWLKVSFKQHCPSKNY